MFEPLTRVIEAHVGDGRLALDGVARVMQALAPVVARARVSPRAMPYGRYLAALDPAGRYNLQVDVFSAGYVGGFHGHGTWGVFFVLTGQLLAEDVDPDGFRPIRTSLVGPGGACCFAAPHDWHRVTVASDEQVKSLHLYGPGFDLDEGIALGEHGIRRYRRSPFADPAGIAGLLAWA